MHSSAACAVCVSYSGASRDMLHMCLTCGFDIPQLSNSLRATGYPFVGLLAFSGSRTRLVLAIQVHASIY